MMYNKSFLNVDDFASKFNNNNMQLKSHLAKKVYLTENPSLQIVSKTTDTYRFTASLIIQKDHPSI